MKKIILLLIIIALAYFAFNYWNAQNELNQFTETEKAVEKCKASNDPENCIYTLAIQKSDSEICSSLGEMGQECIEDIESVKTWSDCENLVHFRQIDACSIKFPEKFAKINCNLLEWEDLRDYCKLAKEES